MIESLKLMCVLAHPDDESLGMGGCLAKYAAVRAAAQVLGLQEVAFLDYPDGALDQAEPPEAIGRIVRHIRRIKPQW